MWYDTSVVTIAITVQTGAAPRHAGVKSVSCSLDAAATENPRAEYKHNAADAQTPTCQRGCDAADAQGQVNT